MIETKKAHELDLVELTEDLPEFGLRRGERGTVVEAFEYPEEAYVLEFVDASDGSGKLAYGVKPDQIRNVDAFEREYSARSGTRSEYVLEIGVGRETSEDEVSAVVDSFVEPFKISINRSLNRFSENVLPFEIHIAIRPIVSGAFYDLLKTAILKLRSKPEIKRNLSIGIKKHDKTFYVTKHSCFMQSHREEKTYQSIDDLFDDLKEDSEDLSNP